MDGMELLQQLEYELGQAENCANLMQRYGREKAEAERAYRMELSKTMLRLRAEGMPVSVLPDICRGIPEIADLRCARDCAESDDAANRAAHYMHKDRADIYREIIKLEWRS